MSENKFIAKLKGVKSAKSVVEVQDPKAKKSFTGIAGTSDSPQGYSLDTTSSVVVANGAKNWTCGYGTLTQSADYRGDGSDYTGSWNAGGAGLWMNATYVFPASDDPSNSTVAIINPNAKWVLTLFGAGLLSDGANVVKLKLVVQIGAKNIASKDFVLPVHAFQFCEQLAVDFTESTTEQIKVDGGTQLNVQLLCEDENAHAQIFSGMTVLTLLDRKIDARDVASNKTSFDDLGKRVATNAQAIDVIESKIPANASPTNKMATAAEISNLQTQITNNDNDIVNLQTQITSNDTDIVNLQTQITSNDTDIANLQSTKADKATEFQTPITSGNKGATMAEINNLVQLGNKITNCVLQIPQNINLELNNGTLTLKAGSKTYMPRSGGGFDELVTTKDITYSHPNDGEYLLFIESQGRSLTIMETVYCFSGTTEPEKTGYKVWYDTGTNIINYYNADNVASKQSFPIAKITVSGGQISSIDAVFNGFGFIGNSIFALPGVVALTPNGRNKDGSLNNTKVIVSDVIVRTLPNTLSQNTALYISNNYISTLKAPGNYNFETNYNMNGQNVFKACHMGTCQLTQGTVSNFMIKNTFRAVDYWDFNKLVKEVDNAINDLATGWAKTDLSNISEKGIDTAVGWGMPDYSAGISGSTHLQNFTCDRDYLFIFTAYRRETGGAILAITIDNHVVHTLNVKEQENKNLPLYIKRGSIVTTSAYAGASVQVAHTRFPLLKGA